ncbi:plasmid maintenance protein [Borreliella afzelii]|nr:putative SnoaL-like aldol condensation-catalyzing enzyme [Borreliella afzelii]
MQPDFHPFITSDESVFHNVIMKNILLEKANLDKSNSQNLLIKLVENNHKKTCTDTVKVSYVESLIKKMCVNPYKRMLKVYWAISVKNKDYKKTFGVERYSACDIYRIVAKLLEKDGKRVVCNRTVQRDIKILNDLGLIQTVLRKFGKHKTGHGSVAHYIQNMQFVAYHKEIIWEYFVSLLEEKLANKKIVGDFDWNIQNAVFKVSKFQNIQNKFQNHTKNTTSFRFVDNKVSEKNSYGTFEQSCDITLHSQHSKSRVNTMSPHESPPVINKDNISNIKYKNSKNSIYNSKILKNNINFEKKDVESRLIQRDIPKDFLYRVKDLSNNESTYKNALNNLETVLDDHKDVKLKYILEHFLEQFSEYRYKVWMMMKRNDGVISDYDLIWKDRFTEFVSKKVELNDYVKKVLAMEAKERENRSRERLERSNNNQVQSDKQIPNSVNQQQYNVNRGAPPQLQQSQQLPHRRIYERENTKGIVKDSSGFKSLKGLTLDSLGISKKVI